MQEQCALWISNHLSTPWMKQRISTILIANLNRWKVKIHTYFKMHQNLHKSEIKKLFVPWSGKIYLQTFKVLDYTKLMKFEKRILLYFLVVLFLLWLQLYLFVQYNFLLSIILPETHPILFNGNISLCIILKGKAK